jgi:hypothetical protein
VKSSVDHIEYFFEFHNLSLRADGKKLAKLCKGLIIFGLETMAIPRRYRHFLFGLIQSGFTTAIAAAIATTPLIHNGPFCHPLVQVMDPGLGDNDSVCSVSYPAHPQDR